MIIIAPYARPLRNGNKQHPKNYAYWSELLGKIRVPIVQIGVTGEVPLVGDFRNDLSFGDLAKLVEQCDTWISVDSFFQHFCWDLGKKGIVLFGQSDPLIFGHPENVNLLKHRSYLRPHQFWWWEQSTYIPDAFVEPDVVLEALSNFIDLGDTHVNSKETSNGYLRSTDHHHVYTVR